MHRDVEKKKMHISEWARHGIMCPHLLIASVAFLPTFTHTSREHTDTTLVSLLLSSLFANPLSLPPPTLSLPLLLELQPKSKRVGNRRQHPPQPLSDKSTCRCNRPVAEARRSSSRRRYWKSLNIHCQHGLESTKEGSDTATAMC